MKKNLVFFPCVNFWTVFSEVALPNLWNRYSLWNSWNLWNLWNWREFVESAQKVSFHLLKAFLAWVYVSSVPTSFILHTQTKILAESFFWLPAICLSCVVSFSESFGAPAEFVEIPQIPQIPPKFHKFHKLSLSLASVAVESDARACGLWRPTFFFRTWTFPSWLQQ